jgi:uncharacterized protein YegL
MAFLKDFVTQTARPLPVILLADVSGSMTVDGKIDTLNAAVKDMLDTFQNVEEARSEVFFLAITFGNGQAQVHTPFKPATKVKWSLMQANGNTPMGAAFKLLTDILEDVDKIPSRSYRPTIVLISDGVPTDDWQHLLDQLLASPRAGKAYRMAMGIGEDADTSMLKRFLADPEQRVFSATDARDIQKFFRYVTMSVTSRSRSQSPNAPPALPPMSDDLDELEF